MKISFITLGPVHPVSTDIGPDRVKLMSVQLWLEYPLIKASEYDQEIPQSHTAVQPTIPRGRATEH